MPFADLYALAPERFSGDIPLFGRDRDGDYFDEGDVRHWRETGFNVSWTKADLLNAPSTRHLIDEIVLREKAVIDLACGPGMGLIPSIRQAAPLLPCLALDASPLLLTEWDAWLKESGAGKGVSFAQCSLMALPFRDEAVEAYSSFIGLSSTREGVMGYRQALAEISRTLKPGGRLYAVENEWTDIPVILELFCQMGQTPWRIFTQPQVSWKELFTQAGLRIVFQEPYLFRALTAMDNDLGQAAEKAGRSIGLRFTAFIVEKP